MWILLSVCMHILLLVCKCRRIVLCMDIAYFPIWLLRYWISVQLMSHSLSFCLVECCSWTFLEHEMFLCANRSLLFVSVVLFFNSRFSVQVFLCLPTKHRLFVWWILPVPTGVTRAVGYTRGHKQWSQGSMVHCRLLHTSHWCSRQAASQVSHTATDGGPPTSANHCRTPSIRCARPHGLELSAGRPPRTAGLWVL